MTTYRNKNFTKRDFECTNVVAAVAAPGVTRLDGDSRWEVVARLPEGLSFLYAEAGIEFYGYM